MDILRDVGDHLPLFKGKLDLNGLKPKEGFRFGLDSSIGDEGWKVKPWIYFTFDDAHRQELETLTKELGEVVDPGHSLIIYMESEIPVSTILKGCAHDLYSFVIFTKAQSEEPERPWNELIERVVEVTLNLRARVTFTRLEMSPGGVEVWIEIGSRRTSCRISKKVANTFFEPVPYAHRITA